MVISCTKAHPADAANARIDGHGQTKGQRSRDYTWQPRKNRECPESRGFGYMEREETMKRAGLRLRVFVYSKAAGKKAK